MTRWLTLCVPLLLFVFREWAEASMVRSMVGATAVLLVAGWCFAGRPGARLAAANTRWNALGLPGLLFLVSVQTVWMIPNALELAIAEPRVDAMRLATLFLAGAALRLSLVEAGLVMQLFFVGNAVTMTIFVGVLFQSLPDRLCNVFLVDDQARAGVGLVALGAVAGGAWILQAWRGYVARQPPVASRLGAVMSACHGPSNDSTAAASVSSAGSTIPRSACRVLTPSR